MTSITKITRPKVTGIVPRKRLFSLLDAERNSPVVWIAAPGGSGKTTLAANYLDARKLPCLWYRVDEGDADIATFFYYMGAAAKKANPLKKKPLPPFAPEYLQNIPLFAKRYFEGLYRRINLARQIGLRLKSKHLEFMCLIADAQFALDIRTVTQKTRDQKEIDHKAHKGHKETLAATQNQKSEMAKRGIEALRKAMKLGRE